MPLTVRHNKRKIERALKKKRIYEDTDVKTYFSYGSKDYGDQLLFKLSQQMHLPKKELLTKIMLFGSFGKGTNKEDSDFDICVITDQNKRKIDMLKEIRLSTIGKTDI